MALKMNLLAAMLIALPATGHAEGQATAHQANGDFEVTVTPESKSDAPIGSMAIAKTFHGDLAATGVGTMLSAGNPAAGSAGYVAMERVTGTLDGRQGSFALQHSGTMEAGHQALSVAVVPGSGSEGLAGISGTMTIRIAGGKHFYSFDYALPAR